MNKVRFIDDPVRNGPLNMAIDDLLAVQAGSSNSSIVLRFYGWRNPSLSCGFHQRIEKRVNFENCHKNGVDLVRRPTGGRELLHDGDLSFSVVKPVNLSLSAVAETKSFFLQICNVITGCLVDLGIKATIVTKKRKTAGIEMQPCLAASAQYEVESDGKKIVPIAQRIYPDSILVHGSIPLEKSKIPTASLLKVDNYGKVQKQIDNLSTNLFQLLGKEITHRELKQCFLLSFKNCFNCDVEYSEIDRQGIIMAKKQMNKWTIN